MTTFFVFLSFVFLFYFVRKKMEEENSSEKENRKLFYAVEDGDEELVKVLLQKRKQEIDLNFKNKDNVFFLLNILI